MTIFVFIIHRLGVTGSDWEWCNVAEEAERCYERGYEGHKESGDDE